MLKLSFFRSFHCSQRSVQQKLSHLSIFDTFGVLIPASTHGMINCFKKYGVLLTEADVKCDVLSSEHAHITKLVRKHLQIKDTTVENQFISLIVNDFPKSQLECFQHNVELTRIIDLEAIQRYQQDSKKAIVVTSMFPDSIFNFLKTRFQQQGFYPNAFLNCSCAKIDYSALVRESMRLFPAKTTYFFVDTVADAGDIRQKIPNINVVGVVGESAEMQRDLASRFIDEADATDVIYSFAWQIED
jgi:hypothetical protein